MSLLKKRPIKVPLGKEVFTSILGGSEGGLATTTAIVAGLFITTLDRDLVVTTAFISFIVQAFNGSVSRFSAERTNDEIEQTEDDDGYRPIIIDAATHLLSHVVASLIVITPIIFVTNNLRALVMTISLALTLLFVMGAYKAKVLKNEIMHEALESVLLGTLIIMVGVVAGWALR